MQPHLQSVHLHYPTHCCVEVFPAIVCECGIAYKYFAYFLKYVILMTAIVCQQWKKNLASKSELSYQNIYGIFNLKSFREPNYFIFMEETHIQRLQFTQLINSKL